MSQATKVLRYRHTTLNQDLAYEIETKHVFTSSGCRVIYKKSPNFCMPGNIPNIYILVIIRSNKTSTHASCVLWLRKCYATITYRKRNLSTEGNLWRICLRYTTPDATQFTINHSWSEWNRRTYVYDFQPIRFRIH